MLKSEAYKTLNLPETATKEEVKKAFKKLAAKHHPDVNKEPTAEQTFKSINEAYQAIENNTFDDHMRGGFGGGFGGINLEDIMGGLGDFFGGSKPRKRKAPKDRSLFQDISTSQTITFKEAVLGIKKDLTYACSVQCEKCQGEGEKALDNGCKKCKGSGRITNQQGNMIFSSACNECHGKIEYQECKECQGLGYVMSSRTVNVSIKPGITNNAILRLNGMGNYTMAGFTSVLLTIHVEPIEGLSLQGQDVLGSVHISLLEALTGCTKEVITIDGAHTITIPAASKHQEEVIIDKLGVGRTGKQRVSIQVAYPNDLNKLIDILKEEV